MEVIKMKTHNKKYTLEDIKNELKEAGLNPKDWSNKNLEKMKDQANEDLETKEKNKLLQ